jgi:tetratricopeptide (TPR) repeat protein
VQAAVEEARRLAERDPSVFNLHALGTAWILAGDYDQSIGALERAAVLDSDRATIQSDLAAAYLARAAALDRREDYARALAAAERAVRAEPGLREGRFNRALAVESLLLGPAVERAWREFLTLEPSGPWADEARAHIEGATVRTPDVAPAR